MTLPICNQPECTREDHLIGSLRAENVRLKYAIEAFLGDYYINGFPNAIGLLVKATHPPESPKQKPCKCEGSE